jgi:hypothetical protein
MISSPGRGKHTPLYVTAGWLFAELLLGIALVFLISSPGAQPTPVATPTPTLFVSPTPTPKVPPPLELQPFTLQVTGIDVNGLTGKVPNPTAVNDFQDAIMRQVIKTKLNDLSLVGLCAGLVIPYGGDPANATPIGDGMIRALQSLGTNTAKQGQFFKLTKYHDPLIWLGQPYGTVKVEVYVYTGATPCQSTSNG